MSALKKGVAAATIGGATIIAMNAVIQIANYKKNPGQTTMLAVLTLFVGISAINYSVNKIKYD